MKSLKINQFYYIIQFMEYFNQDITSGSNMTVINKIKRQKI